MNRRHVGVWLLACTSAVLVACATPPPPSGGPSWRGRLALQVQGSAEQSFSAAFELTGSAAQGELLLLSPFGAALGQLQWWPGRASLTTRGETRTAPSVEALMESVMGLSWPLAPFFDWLNGRPTPLSGWEVDLSGHSLGRLRVRRLEPAPMTELRLVLER